MSDRIEALLTLRDFIRWGASRFNEEELFFGHGTDNALDEAAMLVLHALHLSPDLPPAYLESRLTADERRDVVAVLRRRIAERLPAAYITEEAWFAGLLFYVNQHVLVPRSPIAELIARGFSPWLDSSQIGRILDLCTGSGCIGIASAISLANAKVDLVDISEQALAVARKNIARHAVEDQVEVIRSDLFASLPDVRYDIIVSNPPYVSREELARLPQEYQREPALALAGGDDGLDIVRRILRGASSYLAVDGILVVEVGSSAKELIEHYPKVSFTWLEFARGGEGVFLLTAAQLGEYQDYF